MNTKRIILSTILIWIVGGVLGMVTCGWLFNWVYQIEPIIWKTNEEILSTPNMVGSYIGGLIIALIFVYAYAWIYKGLPHKGVHRGITYGFIVWLVGALGGISMMPFYMTIAIEVILYWIISAFVMNLIYGVIVGAIYKD